MVVVNFLVLNVHVHTHTHTRSYQLSVMYDIVWKRRRESFFNYRYIIDDVRGPYKYLEFIKKHKSAAAHTADNDFKSNFRSGGQWYSGILFVVHGYGTS